MTPVHPVIERMPELKENVMNVVEITMVFVGS